VAIGINVHDLTRLSRTPIRDGEAVQTVGKSLGALRGLPLIGAQAARDSAQIQQAGASAVAGGQTSAASIQALSVLLAIAVALLPSVPVFGLYLPARIDRVRERRAVAKALSGIAPIRSSTRFSPAAGSTGSDITGCGGCRLIHGRRSLKGTTPL
jgi:hypothetical protein